MSFDQMTLWEKELPCGKTQPAISSKQAECVCVWTRAEGFGFDSRRIPHD